MATKGGIVMGYMKHNAIIVTGFDKKRVLKAHKKAIEIFTLKFEGGMGELWNIVTPIMVSPINGYHSFFVAPDGSKEGWSDSDEGDKRRKKFIDWLIEGYKKNDLWLEWVEVQYADGNGVEKITRSSEEISDSDIEKRD
jgi:hypothetical protein